MNYGAYPKVFLSSERIINLKRQLQVQSIDFCYFVIESQTLKRSISIDHPI